MIRRIFSRFFKSTSSNLWNGKYASWQDAKAQCGGYDDSIILHKVATAINKVKNGEAAYERDSVVFSEYTYSEYIKSALLEALPPIGGYIVDFGGSLGSLYFQYKRFLEGKSYTWTVVEQSHFVSYGKTHLQDNELRFEMTIQEAELNHKTNLLIASGVICYLENPYYWVNNFIELNSDYILIDRNAFVEGDEELITIQTVPKEIYEASYPAWFLNEKKFLSKFASKYDLVRELPDTIDGEDVVNGKRAYRKGFLFKRRD